MGTSLRVISFVLKLKFCAPVEVAPPTGATHLIKHASDQISKQAAKRVDHDGPEKVQHRHHLLSEVVPTAALYRAGRGKASGLSASVLSADLVSRIQRPVRGKQAVIRRAVQLIKGVIDFPFVKRHAHGLSAGVAEQAYHIPRGTDSGHEALYLPERILPACVHVSGELRAEGGRGRKGGRRGGERLPALGHVQLREVGYSFGKA